MRLNNTEFPFQCEFTDSEYRCIEVFKKRASEFLEERQALNLGIITFSISREEDGRLSGGGTIPEEKSLKNFYLAFRFFFYENEPSHFYKVLKIINKKTKASSIRAYIKDLKRMWKGSFAQNVSNLHGSDFTSEEIINLWFNAHFFHSDLEKEKRLQETNHILSLDLSKCMLFMSICDAGLAISNLYGSIKDINKHGGAFILPTKFVNAVDAQPNA